MRLLLLLTILTSAFYTDMARALIIEFKGPCFEEPLHSSQVESSFTNVGAVTISELEKSKIPYMGNEIGLHTAFNTPIGMDALEVISDEEMKSYGWCYAVDGEIPEIYPVDYTITKNIRKITWFFGYARYFRGEWTDQCLKAYKNPPAYLCSL
jgi:hypothetical protein